MWIDSLLRAPVAHLLHEEAVISSADVFCLECSGFGPRVGQGPPHTDPGCRGSAINPPGKLRGLRCSQGPGPGGHGPGVGEGAGCLQPGHGESGCCLPGAVRCSPPPPAPSVAHTAPTAPPQALLPLPRPPPRLCPSQCAQPPMHAWPPSHPADGPPASVPLRALLSSLWGCRPPSLSLEGKLEEGDQTGKERGHHPWNVHLSCI